MKETKEKGFGVKETTWKTGCDCKEKWKTGAEVFGAADGAGKNEKIIEMGKTTIVLPIFYIFYKTK